MEDQISLILQQGCQGIAALGLATEVNKLSLIEKIKLAGTRIIVWVINNENHINELIDYGVDGLIVDDCLLLKKILIKKGLW